ncbi:MAG: hypothetical protein AB7O38_15830, partial [Pirellulaceae bacterium]
MKDIDFLPARFRERDRSRRNRNRRLALFAAMALLLVAAHGVQLALARGLRLQLREIAGRYDQSVATNARLEALRHELESNRHFAELYTYLELPWPRTPRLLAVTQT